jgi:hypothetical protein
MQKGDGLKFSFYDGRPAYPNISFPENLSSLFSNEIPDKTKIESLSTNKFVLLHTGRCGSTLLHHLMAPHTCPPFEIFNKESAGPIISKMGAVSPVAIIDYLSTYHEFYAHTPFLSISITPWQLMGLYNMFPGIAEWLFKDSFVVVLLRRNIIKQAMSYASAENSGVWHSFEVGNTNQPTAPDLLRIAKFIDLLVWGENSLDRNPLVNILNLARRTLSLSYEGLIENKEDIALMIMKELGFNISANLLYNNEKLPIKPRKNDSFYKAYTDILDNLPIMLPSNFVVDDNYIFSRLMELPH